MRRNILGITRLQQGLLAFRNHLSCTAAIVTVSFCIAAITSAMPPFNAMDAAFSALHCQSPCYTTLPACPLLHIGRRKVTAHRRQHRHDAAISRNPPLGLRVAANLQI